jgi:hypothetical protein
VGDTDAAPERSPTYSCESPDDGERPLFCRNWQAYNSVMGSLATDYEIRLHHADGTLSLVMMTAAISDADAKAQAIRLLKEGLANAHIWRDGKLVDSVYALDG